MNAPKIRSPNRDLTEPLRIRGKPPPRTPATSLSQSISPRCRQILESQCHVAGNSAMLCDGKLGTLSIVSNAFRMNTLLTTPNRQTYLIPAATRNSLSCHNCDTSFCFALWVFRRASFFSVSFRHMASCCSIFLLGLQSWLPGHTRDVSIRRMRKNSILAVFSSTLCIPLLSPYFTLGDLLNQYLGFCAW